MNNNAFESRLIVYGMYCHLLDSFEHLNKLQVVYRNLVSLWLLAAFAGIGYVLSVKEAALPFHPLFMISVICLAAYIGVLLICYMDFIVSERSMAALVHDAKELEKEHSWLPQIVFSCAKINHLLGYINMKALFYMGCYLILTVTFFSSGALFLLTEKPHWSLALVLAAIFIFFIVFSFVLLFAKNRKNPYAKIDQIKNGSHDG